MNKINIGLNISAKFDGMVNHTCDNCPFFMTGYYPDPNSCLLFKEELVETYVSKSCKQVIYNEQKRKWERESTCAECGGTGDKHYILCPTTKDW